MIDLLRSGPFIVTPQIIRTYYSLIIIIITFMRDGRGTYQTECPRRVCTPLREVLSTNYIGEFNNYTYYLSRV
jgi:hypothetical protein